MNVDTCELLCLKYARLRDAHFDLRMHLNKDIFQIIQTKIKFLLHER